LGRRRGGYARSLPEPGTVTLLVFWIVCPEPDQATEALNDRGDLHSPAYAGIPRRQTLPETGRVRKVDRQQVDV
jgi:hypothetical protein